MVGEGDLTGEGGSADFTGDIGTTGVTVLGTGAPPELYTATTRGALLAAGFSFFFHRSSWIGSEEAKSRFSRVRWESSLKRRWPS